MVSLLILIGTTALMIWSVILIEETKRRRK